jgi:hypothetical protein
VEDGRLSVRGASGLELIVRTKFDFTLENPVAGPASAAKEPVLGDEIEGVEQQARGGPTQVTSFPLPPAGGPMTTMDEPTAVEGHPLGRSG